LENEKEREIYQAKIEFFTNVAHEIRTPLTLIKGPLEKILKETPSSNQYADDLKVIDKNTNRLLKLTNQLLDFRKAETKDYSLNFIRTNFSELIADTYVRFKPQAEKSNLSFKIDLPELPIYAYVDPEACTKILSNLFNNAIKYSDSRVLVKLLPWNESMTKFTLEVRNDGNLIPTEMKDKIFEPFVRLESQHQIGTGIGLAIAKSLAELHNGTLHLAPSEHGMNIFVLHLPIHQANEFDLFDDLEKLNAYPVEDKLQLDEVISDKPIVLVVEDNKELVDFLTKELSTHYTILKAYNGNQAIQILAKQSVSIIISDIMMPEMNGIELCNHVKGTVEYSHIPIILLTAKTGLQAKIEGLESGADAYIEKPFSPDHLRVQINNLLSNRAKLREYFANSPLAHLKTMACSNADESFLEKLNDIINKNLENTALDVEQLADFMNMSRPTLYRKINAISNLTPNELINIARLKKAAELLTMGEYKIYEVAHMVGYTSQTNFGRNFLKQFGMTPTEFINSRMNSKKE
jgi:DNA-binding response OmpR family regulator